MNSVDVGARRSCLLIDMWPVERATNGRGQSIGARKLEPDRVKHDNRDASPRHRHAAAVRLSMPTMFHVSVCLCTLSLSLSLPPTQRHCVCEVSVYSRTDLFVRFVLGDSHKHRPLFSDITSLRPTRHLCLAYDLAVTYSRCLPRDAL